MICFIFTVYVLVSSIAWQANEWFCLGHIDTFKMLFSHKLITHHTLMSFDILTVLSINKPISPSQFLIKLLNTIIVHHSLLIHTRHSKQSGYSYQYNVWTTTYRGVTMSTHLIHRSYVTCFALSKFQLIIIVL